MLRGHIGGQGLADLAADRRARHDALCQLDAPDLVTEAGDAIRMPATPARPGTVLRGLGAAPGVGRGTARLIRHPDEGARLQPGDVLVAPSTDPAWTPLFLSASALVMETGGMVSHGVIVAREYGLPAVINLPGALGRITDGQKIEVDGGRGEVRLEDLA